MFRVVAPRRSHFTVLGHHAVRNRALTRRARGLLWELLSLPPGWDVRHEWLTDNAADSRHKLQEAVRELREGGYLRIDRASSGQTTWVITDDPDELPLPHPDNQDEAHPDYPHPDNQDVTEERTTSLQEVAKKKGAPPPLGGGQETLFAEDDDPNLTAFIEEVVRFCKRTGVKKWPLKSETLEEWCRGVFAEVQYAGLDFAHQTKMCGEHWEPKKAKGQPHRRIRNWLNNALRFRERDGEGPTINVQVDSEHERRDEAIREAMNRRRRRSG